MSERPDLSTAVAEYQARLSAREAALSAASAAVGRLGNLRLVLVAAALLCLLLPLYTKSGGPWWLLLPLVIVFMILGRRLDLAFAAERAERAAVRYYQDGLARLGAGEGLSFLGRPSAPAPAEFTGGEAAFDLDLFGPHSVFQLLSRAQTERGRATLSRWLTESAPVEEAKARQGAALALALDVDQRERLVRAAGEVLPPKVEASLLQWAEPETPPAVERLWRIVGLVAPVVFLSGFAHYLITGRGALFALAAVIQLILLFLSRSYSAPRVAALSQQHQVLTSYARLIAEVEALSSEDPRLASIRARLNQEGAPASAEFAGLRRRIQLLEANLNAFFGLTIGAATLWELNLCLRAEAWRRRVGPQLGGWLEAIAEVEALASLGAFAYEHPGYAWAELDAPPGSYEAEGLVHPLIDPKAAVANDLALGGPGSVLLLSGSNMSGKSTLLRAIGISSVLARMGSVTPARGLRLGPQQLASSVRIVDSLATGTSHLYAELRRLKEIIEAAEAHEEPLVYLLDEVLHGTNSKERYIGAVAVVRWLAEQGAIGVVTTHDLSLTALADHLPPGRVTNQHLADEVTEGGIHFDYTLKDGPVKSTNALRLMRAVGITVPLDNIEAPGGPQGAKGE